MTKVFIPNKSYHDFSEATRFGDLVYLTSGKISILSIGRMYRTFMPIIQASTKEDYILVSGPSVMTSILCSMFSIKHGVLNLLIYQIGGDNKGHYKQRRISFEELTQDTPLTIPESSLDQIPYSRRGGFPFQS